MSTRNLIAAITLALPLTLLATNPGSARATPTGADPDRVRLEQAVADHQAGRLARAERAFEALAGRGVPAAAFSLGVMHLRGEAAHPDRRKARRLFERAAAAGFATAQFALGRLHETGALDGRRDLEQAHRWYEAAAGRGSVEAQVEAGTAYYLGRGAPKSASKAAAWYLRAARGGDVGAMYLLASMLEQGDGVTRDLAMARHWYAQAAAQGDLLAAAKAAQIDAAEAAL